MNRTTARSVATAAGLVAALLPAWASDSVTNTVPETPDATADQLTACYYNPANHGLADEARREHCLETVHGMSAMEFLAIASGCHTQNLEPIAARECASALEKLRPMFVRGQKRPPRLPE